MRHLHRAASRRGAWRAVQRLALLLAGSAALLAAHAWFAPRSVPATAGLPFGCGSPAHPNGTGLAGVICPVTLDAGRWTAGAAAAVAVLALVVAAAATGGRRRRTQVLLGLLVAAPPLAASAVLFLAPTEIRSSDGETVVTCGPAVSPTADPFERGLCADLPGNRLATGLALAGAAAVLGVGVPAVASAARAGDAHAAGGRAEAQG